MQIRANSFTLQFLHLSTENALLQTLVFGYLKLLKYFLHAKVQLHACKLLVESYRDNMN